MNKTAVQQHHNQAQIYFPYITMICLGFSAIGYSEQFILDDFNDSDAISALGTQWFGITDQVMGGRSELTTRFEKFNDEQSLVIGGKVSLENNGGFIQVQLPLPYGKQDLSAYQGIYIRIRGRPGSYSVHFRTPRNRRPWSYYAAQFTVEETWKTVFIPWSQFQGQNTSGQVPDISSVKSIAIVAGNKAFEPELFISEIGVFRMAI